MTNIIDPVDLPRGSDTEHLRFLSWAISPELKRKQLVGERLTSIMSCSEWGVSLSPAVERLFAFTVPLFVGPSEPECLWRFELKHASEFEAFRTELPSEALCPLCAIEGIFDLTLRGDLHGLSRECRSAFEVEGPDLLVLEPIARMWRLYLESEIPGFVFDEDDQFLSIPNLGA